MILAWGHPVTLSMRSSDKHQKLRFKVHAPPSELSRSSTEQSVRSDKTFDLDLIRHTLQQGAGIDPSSWKTWVKISARTPYMTVCGTISLEPAPSKETQFISLGNQYVSSDSGYNILYEEVNRLFAVSRFGIQEEDDALHKKAKAEKLNDKRFKLDGFTNNELRGAGKGIDRWPRFFIRIELHAGNPMLLRQDQIFAEQRDSLSSITNVLEAMINGFLAEHHLRPRKGRGGKRKHSSPPQGSQGKKSVRVSEPGSSSATETEVSDPGKSQQQNQRLNMITAGDLGGNVMLPKFSDNRSSCMADSFSGWSRIKGLSRKDLSGAFATKLLPTNSARGVSTTPSENVPPTPMVEDHTLPGDISKKGLPQLPHNISIPRLGEPEANEVDKCSPEGSENSGGGVSTDLSDSIGVEGEEGVSDALLSWTDPVTKALVKINARTGSVTEEQPRSRSSYTGVSGMTNSAHRRGRSLTSRYLGSSRSTSDPLLVPKEGSWAASLLGNWENPIFRRSEEAIPQLSIEGPHLDEGIASKFRYSQVDVEIAFKEASESSAVNLRKEGLADAQVIAQVDRKFILIKVAMSSTAEEIFEAKGEDGYVLVLVDQHAADERVRIEALLADLCTKVSESTYQIQSLLGLRSSIKTTRLPKPVTFKISAREHTLFKQDASYFANWGILYDLPLPRQGLSHSEDLQNSKLVVLSLPDSIAERCIIDTKHLADLLRGEIWKREESGIGRTKLHPERNSSSPTSNLMDSTDVEETWPHRIRDCPQGIINMLNSRSCRSAVMFNDELTQDDCRTLVEKLATCCFPFQCAHGRPSMTPLVKVNSADGLENGIEGLRNLRCCGRKEVDFRAAWKKYTPT